MPDHIGVLREVARRALPFWTDSTRLLFQVTGLGFGNARHVLAYALGADFSPRMSRPGRAWVASPSCITISPETRVAQ